MARMRIWDDLPRCDAADPDLGLRCAQTPDHANPHAAIWRRRREAPQLRRWRDGARPVDNGADQFGDLVPAAQMSWAIGCPGTTVVE